MEHIKSPVVRFLLEHANNEYKINLLLKEEFITNKEASYARSKL